MITLTKLRELGFDKSYMQKEAGGSFPILGCSRCNPTYVEEDLLGGGYEDVPRHQAECPNIKSASRRSVPRHLDVDTLWRRVNALPTQCRDAIRKSCEELEECARAVEAALDQHERHADSRRDEDTACGKPPGSGKHRSME